jgi:peptidyl-prolyl cis-trans isomerase B (cyclophilin B)
LEFRIHTEFGDIIVELSDSTPQHRDNFIKIAEEGFYDNLLFHRVMKGFMVQGGDPESLGAEAGKRLGGGGPGYTLEADLRPDLVHVKGALAAARQPDHVNPEKRSSGSQFYLVHGKTWKPGELMSFESKIQAQFPEFEYTDEMKSIYSEVGGAPFLDMNYTVFGFVVDGLDVMDSIAAVKVAAGNRPVEDVKFSVEVLK